MITLYKTKLVAGRGSKKTDMKHRLKNAKNNIQKMISNNNRMKISEKKRKKREKKRSNLTP